MQHYLGYDASCPYCTSIAHSIENESGGSIEAMPLDDSAMVVWRRERFGSTAPWAPTMVRVENGKVDVWAGWKIAPVMSGLLGPSRTLSVLAVLGEESLSGRAGGVMPRVSRRRALWAGLGLTAGTLLFNGSPAMATVGRIGWRSQGPEVTSRRAGTVGEAARMYSLIYDNPDIKNVILEANKHEETTSSSRRLGVKFAAPEDLGPSDGMTQVQLSQMTMTDGSSRILTAFFYPASKLALFHCADSVKGRIVSSSAHLVQLGGWNFAKDRPETYEVLSSSFEGELLKAVPDTVAGGGILAAADPCGGCRGGVCRTGGYTLTTRCQNKSNVDCALGAAGCALCAFCSGFLICLGCVVTGCGSALRSCCNKNGDPACQRCRRRC